MAESIRVLNVHRGGSNRYNADTSTPPEREEAIIAALEENPTDDVVFLDTDNWHIRYNNGDIDNQTGESPGIADKFGFDRAFHIPINDFTLEEERKGVSLTVLTNHEVDSPKVLRLGKEGHKRNALTMNLKLGAETVRLAAVYLPESDAEAQWNQMFGLESYFNPNLRLNSKMHPEQHIPTLIAGDFNAPRPIHEDDPRKLKLYRNMLHLASAGLSPFRKSSGKRGYYANAFQAMDHTELYELMTEKFKYDDADAALRRPTFGDKLALDYIFTRGLDVSNVRVLGDKAISDHRQVIADYDLAA
jgi:endonuclease/exonuclease/phosphatase family metal-dependent hydrolase